MSLVINSGLGTKALELLIENGADAHARTFFGDTAAHYAALGGTLDNLRYLVVERNVSMSKADRRKEYDQAAEELCRKYDFSEVCSMIEKK